MRRRMMLVVAMLVMVTLAAVPTVFAKGGPAEKATGSVWIVPNNKPVGGYVRYVEFDAHEARGDRPAKGHLYWYQSRPGFTFEHKVNIDAVAVDGDCATFSGTAYFSSAGNEGQTLYVTVCDAGSPGTAGDTMEAEWSGGGGLWKYDVVDGNLVVHTYE